MKTRHTLITMSAALLLSLTAMASAQAGKPGSHFIENWDGNGDGRVTLEEVETMRDDLFSSFDGDDDGFLSSEEYDLFDATRNEDVARQPAKAQAMLKPVIDGLTREHNDADGDGKVSREEFVGGSGDWLETIDLDEDGAMTSEDFMAIMKK